MSSLGVGELEAVKQPPRLARIVVGDGGLQMLAQRRRLAQLAPEPAQQAHACGIRHGVRLLGVDTFLAIASRRDERRYLPQQLPDVVVERILDAGRLSGSSRNSQPWTFVVPASLERVEAVARVVFVPENVLGAALVVAVVVRGKGPVSFDAGRAAQNMLLAAWNEGIASCPNGISDADAMHEALELGEDERAVIVLSFGAPQRPRDPESRSPPSGASGRTANPSTRSCDASGEGRARPRGHEDPGRRHGR